MQTHKHETSKEKKIFDDRKSVEDKKQAKEEIKEQPKETVNGVHTLENVQPLKIDPKHDVNNPSSIYGAAIANAVKCGVPEPLAKVLVQRNGHNASALAALV